MASSELQQLELYCRAFYSGSSEEQRKAHDVLLPLSNDASNIGQLQMVLSQSSDLHALIFSASALTKIFTSSWATVAEQQKTNTRKFLLNYLFQRGPDMVVNAPIALQIFVRLLVRIVKLSWLENVSNQNIIEQVNAFLQSSTPHWVVGLTIYTELTSDMQPVQGPHMSRQRRAALSFKDVALPSIAKVGIQTLQQISLGTMPITDRQEQHRLLHQVLQLVVNCLSYDFMGIVPDETLEEQQTVMVPQSWHFLKEESICQLFFTLYHNCCKSTPSQMDSAQLCLQCLVLLAAFRRSFFIKDEERLAQVSQLVKGTAGIIQDKVGLSDDGCYHEMCRLLGKINAANQLSELMYSSAFSTWLEEVFQFTLVSLRNWSVLPNSKHYLLGMWSSIVSSRERRPPDIDRYIQEVTVAYIDSRLKVAEAVAQEEDVDIENPLANDVMRTEQLEAIAFLGRCRYPQIATYVAELFDQTNQALQVNAISQETYQHKISWLIYMMGSLVGGYTVLQSSSKGCSSLLRFIDETLDDTDAVSKSNSSSPTAPEYINAELACKAFQLMAETDKFDSAPEQLELAYLSFLDEFRKYLIFSPARVPRPVIHPWERRGSEPGEADEVQGATARIKELMGLDHEDEVMFLVVNKVIFNLQRRVNSEAVLKKSLQLLALLSTGMSVVQSSNRLPQLVMSGKLLLTTPIIRQTLANHSSPDFAFLSIPKYARHRTSYYSSLSRLLFLDLRMDDSSSVVASSDSLDEKKFATFMEPMASVFTSFNYPATACVSSLMMTPTELRNPIHKQPLIGLFRDLRGICSACNSVDSYMLLFNWLVNKPRQPNQSRIHLLANKAEVWWDDHEVIVPLLKFVSEFVYNKAQRISFDQSSANGVLLFKEASSILVAYGQKILTKSFGSSGHLGVGEVVSSAALSSKLYREKYKGLATALEMFSHILSGNYTNFGVFELYNDTALASSLSLALDMCLAIPPEDLQAFLKALKPVYAFLEVITRQFMPQVMMLRPGQVAAIVRSIEDGLCSFESGVAMQCCASLDHVVRYILEKKDAENEDGLAVQNFLRDESDSLKRVLQIMFQLVVSGEINSTWSLSRPLLGLILLNEESFMCIKQHYVTQPQLSEERRRLLEQCFDELMSGVEPTLSLKNKDNFTRNLFTFTHTLRTNLS